MDEAAPLADDVAAPFAHTTTSSNGSNGSTNETTVLYCTPSGPAYIGTTSDILPHSVPTLPTAVASSTVLLVLPTEWYSSNSKRDSLLQHLQTTGNTTVYLFDATLMCAFGCSSPTCLVIHLFEDDSFEVVPVLDYAVQNLYATGIIATDGKNDNMMQTLVSAIYTTVLKRCDAEKRCALLDSVILTGPAWTEAKEAKLEAAMTPYLACSKFAGDFQPEAIKYRRIPDFYNATLASSGGGNNGSEDRRHLVHPMLPWFGAVVVGRSGALSQVGGSGCVSPRDIFRLEQQQ